MVKYDDEIGTNAIHKMAQRVIHLEAVNVALLNALTLYRAHHDQCSPSGMRPCRCEFCRQADEAIKAAKGGDR